MLHYWLKKSSGSSRGKKRSKINKELDPGKGNSSRGSNSGINLEGAEGVSSCPPPSGHGFADGHQLITVQLFC